MPSEPDWSKNISSETMCTWFYAFAIINAIGAGIGLLAVIAYFIGAKNPNVPLLVAMIIPSIVYFFHFWFAYGVCQRALVNA
jgi:hypothetical protein